MVTLGDGIGSYLVVSDPLGFVLIFLRTDFPAKPLTVELNNWLRMRKGALQVKLMICFVNFVECVCIVTCYWIHSIA